MAPCGDVGRDSLNPTTIVPESCCTAIRRLLRQAIPSAYTIEHGEQTGETTARSVCGVMLSRVRSLGSCDRCDASRLSTALT